MQPQVITGLQQLDETIQFMTNQLADTSKKTYLSHMRYFSNWLADNGLTFFAATDVDISAYRKHLLDTHAKQSASTMLVVTKRLYAIAFHRKLLVIDPAEYVNNIQADTDETPYRTLTIQEAKTILDGIDTTRLQGMRDYMIIAILIRTGIRRAELASLTTASLSTELGHTIVTYIGKSNKRSKAVIAGDVAKKLAIYMKRANLTRDKDEPLFTSMTNGKGTGKPLTGRQITRIVHKHSNAVDLDISPHALRATFITVTLGNGAKLEDVQRTVHHANSRTTLHYQTNKDSITNNASKFFPEI